jgi:hypothetical protein
MEHKVHIHRQYEEKWPEEAEAVEIDVKRRSFLKTALFGGGFFLLGKIFGPSISLFAPSTDLGSVTDFENFRVVENKNGLHFFDKVGNEVLTLDKEA